MYEANYVNLVQSFCITKPDFFVLCNLFLRVVGVFILSYLSVAHACSSSHLTKDKASQIDMFGNKFSQYIYKRTGTVIS